MTKEVESGKSRLFKGALLYFWEELKTMNGAKLKALYRIGSGYLKMKFRKTPPKKNRELRPEDRPYIFT